MIRALFTTIFMLVTLPVAAILLIVAIGPAATLVVLILWIVGIAWVARRSRLTP